MAGAGDAPVALNGDVYLTGPQDGGLAGFQMVLPGKVGPVDLGTVTVMLRATAKPGRDGAKIRSVKIGKRTKAGYRVTVKDAATETWKLVVRVRR